MIGDALRIQRTPRSKPAACSLTRMMERLLLAPSYAAFGSSERVLGDALRILEVRPYSKRLMST